MSEQQAVLQKKIKQPMIGMVISNKMDKTIVVLIERKVQHPLYKKYISKRTKLFAQDAGNKCREGDKVLIASCRPHSKKKCWKLVKVLD